MGEAELLNKLTIRTGGLEIRQRYGDDWRHASILTSGSLVNDSPFKSVLIRIKERSAQQHQCGLKRTHAHAVFKRTCLIGVLVFVGTIMPKASFSGRLNPAIACRAMRSARKEHVSYPKACGILILGKRPGNVA